MRILSYFARGANGCGKVAKADSLRIPLRSANLRVKVPEPFVSQVSKIARPGHPARGKSRFLTAKAVRNDKKEKVLGCGTAEAVPSRPLRTTTLAAASQE